VRSENVFEQGCIHASENSIELLDHVQRVNYTNGTLSLQSFYTYFGKDRRMFGYSLLLLLGFDNLGLHFLHFLDLIILDFFFCNEIWQEFVLYFLWVWLSSDGTRRGRGKRRWKQLFLSRGGHLKYRYSGRRMDRRN
jgi:hypothetical protein